MSASIPPLPPQPPPAPAWRDRSRALVGYGWLLIVSGSLCLLFVLLTTAIVLLAPPTAGAPAAGRALVFNAVFYTAVGVALIVLGVGSIRARRWARSLALVVAWCWFALGLCSLLLLAIMLPRVFAASAVPSSAFTCGIVLVVGGVGVLMVALPLLLALFYRREDVRRTVEARDPSPSWTDALSPTMLAVFLALVVGGFAAFAAIPTSEAFPIFGVIVTGMTARLLVVAFGVLSFLLAWGTWRRSPLAWWGLVLLQVVALVNLFALRRVDMAEYMRLAGYPSDPRTTALQTELMKSDLFLGALLALWLAMSVFVWSLRGQFRSEPPRGQNA
jgi:hypothetical protein